MMPEEFCGGGGGRIGRGGGRSVERERGERKTNVIDYGVIALE